jgi:ABC-type transporter Mla subunit MlaD
MMNRQELHRELERLHREISDADSKDPRLGKLKADLESLLGRGDAASSHYGDLGDQLKDGIYHFDASHPQLAKTMAQVIDSLALFNL